MVDLQHSVVVFEVYILVGVRTFYALTYTSKPFSFFWTYQLPLIICWFSRVPIECLMEYVRVRPAIAQIFRQKTLVEKC